VKTASARVLAEEQIKLAGSTMDSIFPQGGKVGGASAAPDALCRTSPCLGASRSPVSCLQGL